MSLIGGIITNIANTYPTWKTIYNIVGIILSIFVFHRAIYFIISIFFTRKFKKAKHNHKYGICIAARNEEKVIGNLLDSIYKQDYPKDLYQVFVVADNCTDKTAEIARSKGATVYERFNDKDKTKGFALQFLFKHIEEDYKINSFEGYFIFDADNLLKKDYISKMNDAFDEGCKIVTSYRNTKNFDENWISSNYAIHWIRSIRTNHRARSVLRLATNIQGTGYLFASEIVKDGWNYTLLTEDRYLTADAVSNGYQITFQYDAQFYDEQPVNLKIAFRQRLRWSRGFLQVFVSRGPKLFRNIIFGKLFLKDEYKTKSKNIFVRILESIRFRFASFDTLSQLLPIEFINLVRWLIVSVIVYSCVQYTNGLENVAIFAADNWLAKLLNGLFTVNINIAPGTKAMLIGILLTIWFRLLFRIGLYLSDMLMGIYVLIIERKRIKSTTLSKKIFYIIMWPWFDVIGRITNYIAVFKKVTWKPIPHESVISIDELNK